MQVLLSVFRFVVALFTTPSGEETAAALISSAPSAGSARYDKGPLLCVPRRHSASQLPLYTHTPAHTTHTPSFICRRNF